MRESLGTVLAKVPKWAGYTGLIVASVFLMASAVFVHPVAPFALLGLGWFVIVSVRQPFILLIAFMIFLNLRLAEFVPVLGKISAGRILAFAALGIFVLSKLVQRKFSLVTSQHNIWLLLLVFAVLVSAFQSTNTGASVQAINNSFIKNVLLFFLIVNLVTTSRQSVIFIVYLACATALSGAYAMLAKNLGYDPVTGALLVEGTRSALQGALDDPNDLALALLMTTPFSIVAVLDSRGWRRTFFFIVGLFSVGGILATQSRGGLLGLFVGIAVILNCRLRSKLLLAGIMVVFIGTAITMSGTSERAIGGSYEQGLDLSSESRLDTWEAALRMFVDRPIWGVGFDRFADNHWDYSTVTARDPWDRPHVTHNTYLQVLSETGVIGFLPFMMLVFLTLRGAWRMNKDAKQGSSEMADIVKRGFLPCLCAVYASAFFLSQAWEPYFYVLFAFVAANVSIFKLDEYDTK
jgi:putative inorganic carbon (HCO3(-)) transporter